MSNERKRGPYRTLADVLAECTPERRSAAEAAMQFVCESVEARYRDWPDSLAAEHAINAVYDQADLLRRYLDRGTS